MSKRLVAYFSASGVTAKVAENLADAIGADIFEIQPEVPYTKADLNWMDKKSRSTIEMSDPTSRPAIAAKRDNMDEYDTIRKLVEQFSGFGRGSNFRKRFYVDQFLAHKFRNQANRYHCKNSCADNYIGFFFSINADRLPGILNHPPDKIFFSAIDLFHIICFFAFCFCAIICLLSNDKAIIFLHQWF